MSSKAAGDGGEEERKVGGKEGRGKGGKNKRTERKWEKKETMMGK